MHQFKLISTCESINKAWNILQATNERNSAVKRSKIQMLISSFENLRMRANELLADFYSKLNDIANESYVLGEEYLEIKLVRKILRSLPKKFQAKVMTIEESKDIDKLKVEELMGSMRIF